MPRYIRNVVNPKDYKNLSWLGLRFFSFLDDDGVYNKTKEQHWQHLQALFSILSANGLALNLEKCVFDIAELKIHSQRISTAGVAHLRDKVKVDFGFPTPTDCKVSQQFLGMIILPPFSLRDSLDSPAAHCRPSRLSQGSHLAATHVHFI
jgi:hypothetical protein